MYAWRAVFHINCIFQRSVFFATFSAINKIMQSLFSPFIFVRFHLCLSLSFVFSSLSVSLGLSTAPFFFLPILVFGISFCCNHWKCTLEGLEKLHVFDSYKWDYFLVRRIQKCFSEFITNNEKLVQFVRRFFLFPINDISLFLFSLFTSVCECFSLIFILLSFHRWIRQELNQAISLRFGSSFLRWNWVKSRVGELLKIRYFGLSK